MFRIAGKLTAPAFRFFAWRLPKIFSLRIFFAWCLGCESDGRDGDWGCCVMSFWTRMDGTCILLFSFIQYQWRISLVPNCFAAYELCLELAIRRTGGARTCFVTFLRQWYTVQRYGVSISARLMHFGACVALMVVVLDVLTSCQCTRNFVFEPVHLFKYVVHPKSATVQPHLSHVYTSVWGIPMHHTCSDRYHIKAETY